MKKLRNMMMALSLFSAMAATTAFGQWSFTFNEYGTGTWSAFGTFSVSGTTATDPVSGLTTWAYHLPSNQPPFGGLLNGDVVVMEPDGTTPSDLIRFGGTGNANRWIYVFSLGSEGNPADVASLPAFQAGYQTVVESGAETATYVAAATNPGGITSSTTTYNFTSTVVPEPSTFALAGLGGLVMVVARRRQTARK
jgi:hypothetical protein